jgi:hypothetical protein
MPLVVYFLMTFTEVTVIATQLCQKKFYNIGPWWQNLKADLVTFSKCGVPLVETSSIPYFMGRKA